MDITGTKKRVQRLIKVAEKSYKKISELMERMEQLQTDLETTSQQVDNIEYDLAEQRALLEAVAREQGLDAETVLAEADLPAEPDRDSGAADESETDADGPAEQATSRPSAGESAE